MAPTLVRPRLLAATTRVPSPFVSAPDEPTERPGWQHPLTVALVSLGLVLVIVVAFSLDSGTSSDEGDDDTAFETPTVEPTPDASAQPDEPGNEPEPTPVAPPNAPPPVRRIEPDRPERADLWNTALDYLEAGRLGDSAEVATLTWSGCLATGDRLADEVLRRFQPDGFGSYELGTVLVVSANLGVVDVLPTDTEATERLIFVREDEQWRSGVCPDAPNDLGQLVELPADLPDLVRLAGLDYSGADLFQQALQARDLSYANFDDADLSRSNLAGSVFEAATFRGADLGEAWIAGATTGTEGADFSEARLFSAFFTDADLTASRFDGADAVQADFTGARLSEVSFRDADLTGAFIDVGSARLVADWTGAICPDGESADASTGCLTHLNPYG